jgi:hypothetical protein
LRDATLVENHLFKQRVADSHNRATLDIALQLHGVHDNARVDRNRVLLDNDFARARRNGNVTDTSPVSPAA